MSTGRSLSSILDLEQLETRLFRGHSDPVSSTRVFGGQVAAQALVAAGRTLPQPRPVHSLHAYFLRLGDPSVPIVYEVDPIRDGGSFTTRRVVAVQRGEAIFHLSASFHRPEQGFTHQVPEPSVPDPGLLPPLPPAVDGADEATRRWWAMLKRIFPLDIRFVDEPVRVAVARGERPPPRQRIYVRAADALGDDPLVHVCALTYASDLFLLATALPPHGIVMGDPTYLAASLDHALWFHRPFRADEWLLYDMESPWAGDGRALCSGRLFDAQGHLVATVMQEGLVRPLRPQG